jgi:hypothetical protein
MPTDGNSMKTCAHSPTALQETIQRFMFRIAPAYLFDNTHTHTHTHRISLLVQNHKEQLLIDSGRFLTRTLDTTRGNGETLSATR